MGDTTRLFRNATVVSMDPNVGVSRNCDVRINGPNIVEVGPNLPVRSSEEVIDCTDCILSPGFVDTHRHMWQTQLRTVTGDYTLRDYMVKLRNSFGSCYEPDDVYLAHYAGALESINAGTTCLLDHAHIMNSPAHADSAVAGFKDAGIRATFCYGLYENPSYQSVPNSTIPSSAAVVNADDKVDLTDPSWRKADAKRVRYQHFADNGQTQLVRFGLAPFEMERMSTEDLLEEIALGRELGAAIVTGHVAMGTYDRGAKVVEVLAKHDVLGPDLLFSHASSLTPGELSSLRKSAGSIASCPSTEMQMGMGFPIAFSAVHDHECSVGLGTDVAANNSADMFSQMRLLLQCQRWADGGNVPPAQPSLRRKCAHVLRMATQGGAQAVGLGDVTGSITPGKRADIILVRHDSLHMTPMTDPEIALVLYATASDVDAVFIDGVPRKLNGAISGYSPGIKDWADLRSRLEASTKAIFARADSIDPLAHQKNVEKYLVVRSN